MSRALWLWCRGRVDGAGPGTTTFGYTAGTLAIPVAFVVAGIVEAVAVHLLVPWQWLRIVLLILTVASILATACWFAARAVHPHLVTSNSLTLRAGRRTVLELDRERIARAAPNRRFAHTEPGVHDGRLYLPGPDGTVLDIDFDEPIAVEGARAGAAPSTPIVGVSLHVDSPHAFSARLNEPH